MKQLLTQKLSQQQRLSPQQIQQIKLLELPVLGLERRVKEEIEDNPALEEEVEDVEIPVSTATDEVPRYRLLDNNQPLETKDRIAVSPDSMDFHELMRMQLSLRALSAQQREMGEFLIDCLDSDGYLRRPLSDVADDIAFSEGKTVSENALSEVLYIIQDLEPAGVGARDLQECLLLQLEAKEESTFSVELATQIIAKHFDDFTGKRYEKICAALNISEKELKQAIAEITKLNPKPGASFTEDTTDIAPAVTPDFLVEYKDGELQQSLTARNAPDLRVSKEYKLLLKTYAKDKEASEFVRKKLGDARWFIDAVQRRYQTLTEVMSVIVERQKDFFTTGDEAALKPMLYKAVVEVTGYDISTISRVVNSKYVQTNFGIFPLKFFFSKAAQTSDDEEISTRAIKKEVKDLVAAEDKKNPLSDAEIMKKLEKKGYTLARRTVAKYRQTLNIPEAKMRKTI
ncbi:MAG: RNA polymerase factor sigma-54 [Prevotellaceae bacterium]|nr:RNA polymerase factor sigma-54 [Prevotellaceae bacterium]